MKTTFIGGGNMATALITGLVGRGERSDEIAVVEIDAQARKRLSRDLGIRTYAELPAGVVDAACIILAVKPQQLGAVARQLSSCLGDQLVVSIAAGVRCSDLVKWLGGHGRVVRAMPNTPALVLAGVTGLYAAANVTQRDRALAEGLLAVAGTTHWVPDETSMDAVTAISGSGPAYVFYFIEALQEAGLEAGFDGDTARKLAIETFSGAVKLAASSAEDAATLRERVTSPGGTTERAIRELQSRGVRAAIIAAVRAAAERSRELGDALSDPSTKG